MDWNRRWLDETTQGGNVLMASKQYEQPKRVTIVMIHGGNQQVVVDLLRYNDNGVVFIDKKEFGEEVQVFVPYSNIANIVEGEH